MTANEQKERDLPSSVLEVEAGRREAVVLDLTAIQKFNQMRLSAETESSTHRDRRTSGDGGKWPLLPCDPLGSSNIQLAVSSLVIVVGINAPGGS